MMSKIQASLDPYQVSNQQLVNLAEQSNRKLETAGRQSANQAFTLGCTTGFIPAALVVLLAFMITRSWQAVAITAAIMLIVLLACSNLVAYVARGKTMKRSYESEIKTEIEQELAELEVSREQFDRLARQSLPKNVPLLKLRQRSE